MPDQLSPEHAVLLERWYLLDGALVRIFKGRNIARTKRALSLRAYQPLPVYPLPRPIVVLALNR